MAKRLIFICENFPKDEFYKVLSKNFHISALQYKIYKTEKGAAEMKHIFCLAAAAAFVLVAFAGCSSKNETDS